MNNKQGFRWGECAVCGRAVQLHKEGPWPAVIHRDADRAHKVCPGSMMNAVNLR